jgi:hypothetical protein
VRGYKNWDSYRSRWNFGLASTRIQNLPFYAIVATNFKQWYVRNYNVDLPRDSYVVQGGAFYDTTSIQQGFHVFNTVNIVLALRNGKKKLLEHLEYQNPRTGGWSCCPWRSWWQAPKVRNYGSTATVSSAIYTIQVWAWPVGFEKPNLPVIWHRLNISFP